MTRLTPQEKELFVVKQSRNGRGVFARRDFTAKEVLYEIVGTWITGDVDEDIDEVTRDNAYRYDADRYISPKGQVCEYVNHSCEPNLKIVKRKGKLYGVALVAIPKGTELAFDYSTMLARDDIWDMQCNCGTKSCRGVVKRFVSLPKKIKDPYIEKGIVPKYIVNI